ncbi:MAG TPA: cation:proton antiporter [Burkholderiales bacterium]
MDLSFLPALPPVFGQTFLVGALLLAGLLGGELARRALGLPRIVGYALTGVLLGPQVSGVLGPHALGNARVLIDLSLGLIVFELGHRLDFQWLRRNRWLFAAAVAESVFCFWAIHAAMLAFGFAPLLAASAAAIGTATSPAVVLLVAHELRAAGQVTERMLLFTAVNSVFAYVSVTLLLPFLHLQHAAAWSLAVLHPLYLLGGSALAGVAASHALLWLARWVGKREDRQFILLVAVVVLAVGIARNLNLSVVVTLLTLGLLARNLDRRHVLLPLRFGYGGQLFFVILFVLTGASLQFAPLGSVGLAVAAFVAARFAGKALALLAFARLSGVSTVNAGLLSLALLPMSGMAVVMVLDTAALYPEFGGELAAIVLSAVAVLELLGPIATQFALKRAGEADPAATGG